MRGLLRRAVGVATVVMAMAVTASGPASARHRSADGSSSGGVPYLDVRGSCSDAQKFSTGDDKKIAYNGCLQDEMNAKGELTKRWGDFKSADRSNCVEQSRAPSPSYVEVLTCLEMDTDAIRNTPRTSGQPTPQIGGPVAPGLTNNPVPSSTMPGAQP